MPTGSPASGPAGSRRFWVAVLCFAIANVGAWIAYDRVGGLHRRGRLEVRQAGQAEGDVVSSTQRLWWSFNLDVAPAGSPPPGRIVPAVAGTWRWDDGHTLSFVPRRPLPRATPITVTLLPDRLRTADGFSLAGPQITHLHTPGLEVLGVRQSALDEQDRAVIEIEFNDDVLPAEVMQHLSLRSSADKPVAFHPHGEASGHLVRVMTDPLPMVQKDNSQAYVKVRLSAGLGGRSGPLGLERPFERDLPLGSELLATEASAQFESKDDATLSVRFNNAFDAQAIKPLISVEPAVPFSTVGQGSELLLKGAFQPATRYAIRIAKAPLGASRLGRPRPTTLSVYVPDREPSVWFEHEEGYLGSAGNRTLMAHAVNLANLRVMVTRVYDSNLVSWRNHRSRYWSSDAFSRPLASRAIKLASVKNKTQNVRLALDDLLPSGAATDGVYQIGLGPASARAAHESSDDSDDEDAATDSDRHSTWSLITLSDIGLSAKQGREGITVWATSLKTATPLAGVRIRLFSNKDQLLAEAITAQDGIATLTAFAPASGEQPSVILADRGDGESPHRDLTWLDLRTSRLDYGESDTTGAPYLRSGHEAFLYTDRGVYRPGETVHLRAIVRGPAQLNSPASGAAAPRSFPVRWQFRRPDLHDWKHVDGTIDADGAVSLDVPLPLDLPTGRWSVSLGLPGRADGKAFGSLAFQVEEFMPNRMQVALKLQGAASAGEGLPRFAAKNEPLEARVQADYLFGRPVSERPAKLVARIDPVDFAPAQWKGWTIGDSAATAQVLDGAKVTGHRVELPDQTLDGKGNAKFELNLDDLVQGGESEPTARRPRGSHASAKPTDYSGPWRLTVTASVIEAGGRAVTASRQADLDLTPWYIAARAASVSGSPGAPCRFDVRLVAPDGKPAQAQAELEASLYRETWNNSLVYESGRYVYHSTRLLEAVKTQTVRASGAAGSCEIAVPEQGSFVLRLRERQTGAITSCGFYCGQGSWDDNVSRENPEKLELLVQPMPPGPAMLRALAEGDIRGIVASAEGFLHPAGASDPLRVGQTARVIVRSPFAGRLLLSVETDDVLSTRVIDMPASAISVPIQITGALRPNAYVTATVIRPIDPDAKWRTHRAFGVASIPINNGDRKLAVQIDAPPEIRPGQSLTARLHVSDSSGNPVPNAAVTLAAVDEGICQLTGFKTPDPFGFFTRKRALGVSPADLYSQLMPEVPKPDKTSDVGGDRSSYDPRRVSPVSAKRVKPVALVSAVLHTDERGNVETAFGVPQFTGKLRLMAVASVERAFGSAQAATRVRSPLLVQSSWPRFAAPGDRFLVPLVIFNNGRAAGAARVTVRISDGPLRLAGANPAQCALSPVTLAAGAQSTQYLEVSTADSCGVSHANLTATMGSETYEEDVELPVRPASPEIQLGGYAIASPGKPALVSVPGGMLEGTAKLEVRVTPRPTLQLPQGLEYLERYPYGCLEQTTSTLFPLVYLSDIGGQIAPGVFDKERVADKVQVGITRLIGMQTADGGLATWPAYRDSWPWGSVYAAHFLIEAQKAGHVVPEEFRNQLLGYCRRLLDQSSDNPDVLETQAYACYVLALAGKPERAAMSRLTEIVNARRPDGVATGAQARFHLAAAWLASGRRDLAEGLIPQVMPPLHERRELSGSLASPVRERAILASTLMDVEPDHPALAALVQQIADAGKQNSTTAAGPWRSTQDTAFAVMALGQYLRLEKSAVPYDSAKLLLDGKVMTDSINAKPLAWDAGAKDRPIPADGAKLEVTMDGPQQARAHVSWFEVGVPLKPPPAADHALRIRRRFLNEKGRPLATNRVQSGDLVQVELSISSDTPLENLVIEDLLPAGLEIENPRLKTSAANTPEQPTDAQPANRFADERLDLRDDRLVVMGRLASAGSGTYVYTARAVAPGKFVLPPVHAECMYDSAINSIWGAGTFEVVPAGAPRIANIREE